jgi:Zn-finger nucleic acid-binding protein
MEKVEYKSIEVDRCESCHGIWFDMLEAEQLKAIKGSEKIDVGDRKQGEKYNKVGSVNCPVCRTQMTMTVDDNQPHIWYEYCEICHGMFFDAGEFRDYKEETILDFFRDLFSKPRN